MDGRLPAHLEVAAIIRMIEAEGGFATLIARGERDAGTILLLTIERDESATLYERMPQLDGTRPYVAAKRENPENTSEMDEYIARRRHQDPDIWVIEANVADAERFVASLPS